MAFSKKPSEIFFSRGIIKFLNFAACGVVFNAFIQFRVCAAAFFDDKAFSLHVVYPDQAVEHFGVRLVENACLAETAEFCAALGSIEKVALTIVPQLINFESAVLNIVKRIFLSFDFVGHGITSCPHCTTRAVSYATSEFAGGLCI